jgi:hypothetical protein
MPATRFVLPARRDWSHWLGSLLFGLMLVLLVLITAWLLRALAPIDSLLNVATLEPVASPAPPSPPDITPALKVSLDQGMATGKALSAEMASLQAQIKIRVASCKPIEPPKPPALPAENWAKKDLNILKGCWVLGHDTKATRGSIGAPDREENCTTKAARMCFDANGHGQSESASVCPVAGKIYCARPVTAQFTSDGTFTATSPATQCQAPIPTRAVYSVVSCRRVDDYHAMCRRTNVTQIDPPGARFEEAEFRREPQ